MSCHIKIKKVCNSLHVKLPTDMAEDLQKHAKETKTTKQNIVVRALDKYLGAKKND